MEEKCHLCGIRTDFYCRDCDQPVCEDCCVMPTYHNQIDYSLCTECETGREVEEMEEREREWKIEAEIKEKKEKKATARKVAYWKPENVAKRKAKRVALLLARKEASERRMKETVEIIRSIFRGMF